MYDVKCKEILVKKGMFKKERVQKFYLDGQDMYFDNYEYFLDHKIVRMNNEHCNNSEYFYFSTVTGKLIYQGVLYISYLYNLEYYGFVVLSDNKEVFKFSVENNEFVKVAENIKDICVCENSHEKSLCFLNNNGEIEVLDCDSLKLLNKIKFEDKIFAMGTTSIITGDFSLKILKEGDFKNYYIISDSKNFASYEVILADVIKGKMIPNGCKYYIVDEHNLITRSFRSIYYGKKGTLKLDFYNPWYVTITKKNIGKNDTYGLIDLRSNMVVYEPIYDNIIENKGNFIARIYGEDVVIND